MINEQNSGSSLTINDHDRLLGRVKIFHQDQKGQVMVMTALLALVFVLFWSTLFGVGEALGMKMKLQDVADTQVYTEALWGARTMNWIAYVNKAQVANLIIITQFSIIHSHAKFWFDVVAFVNLIMEVLAKIPVIGPIFNVLNKTVFVALAAVVAAYEYFAYMLADYGIPAVAVMIQALCYWQYAWMGFIIWFPERGDEVMRRTFQNVEITDPLTGADVDLWEENRLGGLTRAGDTLSQLGSVATQGGGSASDALTQFGSATLKVALKFYSFYKYYALLRPTDGPTGIDDTSRFTLPQSSKDIPMWKRMKWMTENTATRGGEYSSGSPKSANDHPILKWHGRAAGARDLNIDTGILPPFSPVGAGLKIIIGGDTHVFRWSGDKGEGGGSFTKGNYHRMSGKRIKLRSGLWQWHEADGESYDGWRKWDTFAHDYFSFKIYVELWFFDFTLIELGLHEAELTSEDIDNGGSPDTKNDSDSGNPMGDAADRAAEEAAKARAAGLAAQEILDAYSQWESKATTKANETDPDTGDYLHGDATARAAYRDSILASQDTDDYDYKLYHNGGTGDGASDLGNLLDYNEMAEGAGDTPDPYTEWEDLPYSAWKFDSADDAKAWAKAVKARAQEAEEAAEEMEDSANELDDKMSGLADSISGALYADRPVLVWWHVFWSVTTAGRDLDTYTGGFFTDDDRKAVKRWDIDGNDTSLPERAGDRQGMTWWELDSSVESDVSARHDYKWTTDNRKVSHMTYLTMPYQFGLKNFGLGQWMFSAQDDGGGNRMFDGRGFGVLSRAECVYINSAQRNQWPNLFNPYWRPRLAPISHELTEVLEKIPMFNDVQSGSSGFGATFNSVMRSLFPH